MKRRLIKLGNDSFSITLPKSWVRNNHLAPQTDLNVEEKDKCLIISKDFDPDPKKIRIVFENQTLDSIYAKICGLYRHGYTEIVITFKEKSISKMKAVLGFLSNFIGISAHLKDDHIIIEQAAEDKKCCDALMKCFQNLLLISDYFRAISPEAKWLEKVYDSYNRIYFYSEYAFRMINIEGCAEFSSALKHYVMAWGVQCLGEVVKRIAEIENELVSKCRTTLIGDRIADLICRTYDVLYKNKDTKIYYDSKGSLESAIKERKIDSALFENINMIKYICSKIVKQHIISYDDDMLIT